MWMTRVAINNPVFAAMVMVALCVLGLFSYARLGVEQMPDVSPPIAFVDVRYPGASPEAVERELTKQIEEGLNSIAGVKRITSRSFEGRSQTQVEFTLNADMGRAMQDLRDRMGAVQANFPKDAKQPLISRFDNDNSQPIVVMALLSKTRSARELSILGDLTVGRRLQRVEGVARVDISGLATREVRIDLDAARLRAYGITPAEVSKALADANSDQPVGLLTDATQDSILRVEGRVRDPKLFTEMVIGRRAGLPLTLGDLGQLVEREKEPDSIARINGQRAVSFNVFKQQDANIVATGEAVKAAMEELQKAMPADVELRLIYANSDFVKSSLNGLQHTLIEGALLTIAIVFLFLHSWRSTIITGLTLPIAVISSFIAVHTFGFTLNFMTMMALSLCIGLLIDDAIVVRENIVRHVHLGKDHHTAAREGTDEIGLAVMATTFAICAVFTPVAFMGGVVGKFFYPFGITVTVAVLVSLFVSFTLDPMLSAVWRDPPGVRARNWPVVRHLIRGTDHMLDVMHVLYEKLIRWAFAGRGRRRLIVLGIGVASFVGALLLTPLVGSEFIPQTDQGFTQLSLRMAVGSSLERSDAKVRQVEEVLATFPEVKNVSTNVGGQGNGFAVGRAQATINIGLVERRERKRTQKEVEDAIRDRIAKIPGIEVAVGFNRPIYVAILGSDPEGLVRIAQDFADKVKKIPGIVDVDLSAKPGLPAYAVRLKPGAVRELGLTAPQLASSLRAYVNGDVATYWTTPDGEQVEVVLRLPETQRERIEQMRQLPVAFSRDGTPIALDTVATIEPVVNPDVIRRQNLQRREAIFAGVQGRPAGDVGADVEKLVKET
ncbi:MAG TPA: efflux RND transporter permease subunit, partial [Burkholderiaceae bacterium]|nr:efflux RND transporter permease subunit [Burkholderiaceae bacterium]